MNDDKKPKKPNRNLIIYYGIILLVWLSFSSIILPELLARNTEEISYSQFSEMLNKNQITSVSLGDGVISFSAKDDKGTVKNYTTGAVNDPQLVSKLETAKVNFEKPVPKQSTPFVSLMTRFVIPFIIIFALFQFLFRSLGKKLGGLSGGGAMNFGKSNAKVYEGSETGKTFSNVAGQDEAKEALQEIVSFLHNPQKYTKIGAILPKGVLLVGPPGTGKTLLAQAVAGEAKVPFFSISGSEFVEMFVGMGASKVRDLFKQAKEKAPCIIFIDEVDAIGKKRDGRGFGGNDEREQTLNQLLSEMDGFSGNEGIVILAATNRPEILDMALTRPGRFDRRVPVELPDLSGRESILKVHAKKIQADPNIDYKAIALATAGASGAQLANIVNEAALRAVKFNREQVIQDDLQESVEVVIAGQQKKGAVISQREKEIIAYHEVGHALVAALQSHSAPVTKITIIPRTSGALGYTMQVDQEEKFLMSKDEIFNKIVTYTGGRSAEELVFNLKTTGAANDIQMATRLARAMVTQYGMTDEFGMVSLEERQNMYLGGDNYSTASPGKATEIDNKVEEIIKDAHKKALELLRENEDKLHEISKFLIEKETITGDEFMEILNLDGDKTQSSEEVENIEEKNETIEQ